MNRYEKAWVRVRGDAWNLTWLVNKIFRESERRKVKVYIAVSSHSLEITISVDPVSVAATILIFLISLYIQRQRKLRCESKSHSWAREQAKGWVIVQAKGNAPVIDKDVEHEDYSEFYLTDAEGRKYHCRLWKNCESICEKIH